MARKVKDRELDSKTARSKLAVSPRPYYREIGKGLHLGFRKGKKGGTWVARMYAGNQSYKVESIGQADDDLNDANGEAILSFHQAVETARRLYGTRTAAAGKVAGPYTVSRAIEDYLRAIAGKASHQDSSTRAYTLIIPALGTIDTAKLTAGRIRSWHSELANTAPRVRGAKNSEAVRYRAVDMDDPDAIRRRRATANRTLTILKAALNFAFREEKVASDREWRRVEPFENVDAARLRYLSIAEAQRLVNASSLEFRSLVRAALETGARYSELIRLRVEDFNPDSETIGIRQSKSGKSRQIVLTEDGAAFFRRLTAGRTGDTIMLPKANGEAWRKSQQSRPMAEACKNAKLDKPIGFHGLRHTWASLAVMAGVPLIVVARNLGHADTRMVEKHYGHLAPSYIRDAIRSSAPRFGFDLGNLQPLPARGR